MGDNKENTTANPAAKDAYENESGKKAKKPRRRRWLRRLLIGIPTFLVLLIVVLYFVLQYKLGSIVKWGAEKYGPEMLGAPVSLSNCHARIFSGNLALDGLVIGPPEDRVNPDVKFDANLFELPHFSIDVDPASVVASEGPIVINSIVVDGAFVTYEVKGLAMRTNINALLDNLKGADKKQDAPKPKDPAPKPQAKKPSAPPAKPAPKKEERKVYIEDFVFTNAHVRCALVNGKGLVVPLPTIHLRQIGKKDVGTTKWEAIWQILESIGNGTVDAVAATPGAVVGLVGDAAELVVDAGAAVGGAALDAGDAVIGAAGDALGAAGSAIGDGLGALGGAFGLGDGEDSSDDQ